MKPIGILGGLGPESTGYFYLELIREFERRFHPKDNTFFPHIIINSIPATELIYDRVNKKILSYYIKQLRKLEKNECKFIVIVCNTAYSFLKIFQANIKTQIVNLPDEVRRYLLNKRNVKTITRFITPTAFKHDLFKFKNFKYFDLSLSEINTLEKAIANFNVGKNQDKQKAIVKKLYKKYSKKSDVVILGCSELALMFKDVKTYKVLDPLQVLIKSTLKRYGTS